MEKETLRVGRTSQCVSTVPVNCIFDEIYDSPSFPTDIIVDHFRILEVDGYYITIHESLYKTQVSDQFYKCFLSLSDAQSYLEMFGIIFKEEDI
jgi:hypothetical protein